MTTEGFDKGQRVTVVCPGHILHNAKGTVTGRDYHTVDVRLDKVTAEMMGYSDARSGLVSVEPAMLQLERGAA